MIETKKSKGLASVRVTKQQFCDLISPFGVDSNMGQKLWNVIVKDGGFILVDRKQLEKRASKIREQDKEYREFSLFNGTDLVNELLEEQK